MQPNSALIVKGNNAGGNLMAVKSESLTVNDVMQVEIIKLKKLLAI